MERVIKVPLSNVTLALIKPHVLKHPFAVKNIQAKIKDNGLEILTSKVILFDQQLAETFYGEHKGRFFFNRLVTFMISGPSKALILSGPDAIAKWRNLMGPTKVFSAQFTNRNCIRSEYGLSDTRNAAHGSDSPQSATKEISILFPEIKLDTST